MNAYRVVLTRRAAFDMHHAAEWWATNRSAEQADRRLTGLDERLQTVASSPERYALAPENDEFPFELRELHYGLGRRATHRVVFTIADDLVTVLAVRHAAQGRLRPDEIAWFV